MTSFPSPSDGRWATTAEQARSFKILDEEKMPATMERVHKFLGSPNWTPAEKFVIQWQFRLCGNFKTALWNAIKLADEGNLARLQRGFPAEVEGFLAWNQGDLGRRLRKAGLDI